MGEAQNPEALESIKNLEFLRASAGLGEGTREGPEFSVPNFTAHINDVRCEEGQAARFQCTVEPKNDPSLQTGNHTGAHCSNPEVKT